jgi:hypothetical protein
MKNHIHTYNCATFDSLTGLITLDCGFPTKSVQDLCDLYNTCASAEDFIQKCKKLIPEAFDLVVPRDLEK